jgi:16S rRNA (cytidine1402-2'-O)-methyltransferase
MVGARTASLGSDMQRSADASGPAAGQGAAGVLTIAATPIGQPGDASPRLASALASAPVIAAEDTRRVGRLAAALGISLAGRLVSYYDDVEERRVPALLAELRAGTDVLLVSDAGLPGVSDPGYRLVAAAAEAGVRVTVLPGPSAVLTALAVSGLPTDRFAFEGFLPRKGAARSDRLRAIAGSEIPVVCYESPHRVGQTLRDLEEVCGDRRRVSISRELTKLHEETWRGTLAGAGEASAVQIARGEYVIIVDGTGPVEGGGEEPLAPLFEQLYKAGLARRDAIAAVEILRGVGHRQAYDAALGVPLPPETVPAPRR